MILRITGLILAATLLIGCAASRRQETAEMARTQLVGMSRENLLACAGRPATRTQAEDLEYFVYVRREAGIDTATREPVGATGGLGAPPTSTLSLQCEATVKLEQGKVSSISYRGQSGGVVMNRQEVCGYIFERCVRR